MGDPLEYSLATLDGRVMQTFGRLAASEYAGPIFFQPSIVPHGDQLFVGDPKRYEIRVLELLSGRLRRIIRVNEPPRRVTEEEWRELLASTLPPGATNVVSATQRTRALARLTPLRPEAYPHFSRVRVDPRGRIWIQDYQHRTVWTVLDSAGAFIGHLALESRQGSPQPELVNIEADHVVLLTRDFNGAAVLSFHKLVRLG